jgi:hypothetical protein
MLTRNNQVLPTEYLEKDLRDGLNSVSINTSVSELEHMIEKGGSYSITIPHIIHSEITKLLDNGWVVDSAWQKISLTSIEGIISSIKSNLLTFILELADEIGEKENINIMEHKKKIDNLFDKTIGNLTGETINISIGNENVQSVNVGDNTNSNVAKGENVNQTIKSANHQKLQDFVEALKPLLEKISITQDDKLDILNEISRIEAQLQRNEPKYQIINESLKIVNGILIGVAGNSLTQPIIEQLTWLIGAFNS